MDTLSIIFRDPALAYKAAGALLDHGVAAEHLTLVSVAPVPADPEHVRGRLESPEKGITTTTGEDAVLGAAKGAGVGLGVGALASLACLFIPGFGWVTGGGALATALMSTAGTTAAGALTGSVAGYLVDQGVPAEMAARFEQAVGEEAAILSVSLPSGDLTREEVERIVAKYGADQPTLHPCRRPVAR